MKPYRSIPIHECGDPLVMIPADKFAFFVPHPYVALGAPYGKASPWMVRASVLAALEKAQNALQMQRPGWRFRLFDAYRPNSVQAFMVDREVRILAEAAGFNPLQLSAEEQALFLEKAYRIFAIPSDDPTTPPPHSTGAALDLTLQNTEGMEVDMGSPIDENSDRSNPDYYINAVTPDLKVAHENRVLLNMVMAEQGFIRHPAEWWHFSLGDQMWAYARRQSGADPQAVAHYGRADLLSSAPRLP